LDIDKLERSVKKILRPLIEHAKLLDINETKIEHARAPLKQHRPGHLVDTKSKWVKCGQWDIVLSDVTREVMDLLNRKVLSADMVEPLCDLFMTWQRELPKKQRTSFYENMLWPNIPDTLKNIKAKIGIAVGGKFVQNRTAATIQKKIKEFREKYTKKFNDQIGTCKRKIDGRRNPHATEAECKSYGCKWFSDSIKIGELGPWPKKKFRRSHKQSSLSDNEEDSSPRLKFKKYIEDISGSLKILLSSIKKFCRVNDCSNKQCGSQNRYENEHGKCSECRDDWNEDVDFDLEQFYTKVLRNLLAPIVGYKINKLYGHKMKKATSILYSIRDGPLRTFLNWIEGLRADHQNRVVHTITSKLGW